MNEKPCSKKRQLRIYHRNASGEVQQKQQQQKNCLYFAILLT